MPKHNTYFLEKSSALIRKLIVGEGTAKQRLIRCEWELINVLSIPIEVDLEPVQKSILKKLTTKEAIVFGNEMQESSMRRTIGAMRNSTASKIIGEIYDLHSELKFRTYLSQ